LAVIDPGQAEAVGLALRRSPGGEEETVIAYERARRVLAVDRRRSSLAGDVVRDVRELPLRLGAGEPLELHIFVDGSVLEVFTNGGRYHAARVYPTREDALGVALYARGGRGRLQSLDVWAMESIWRRYVA